MCNKWPDRWPVNSEYSVFNYLFCHTCTGMAYVMSDMSHIDDSGALDMRTRIRLADWCARGSDLAGV